MLHKLARESAKVQSKKILIMPSPSQSSGESVPEQERSFGPYSQGEVRTLFTANEIFKTLLRLEHRVEILEQARDNHKEKIEQVTVQVNESKFSFLILQGAVAQHGDRLRKLDNVVYAAKVIAGVTGTIIVALLGLLYTYLSHHVTLVFK